MNETASGTWVIEFSAPSMGAAKDYVQQAGRPQVASVSTGGRLGYEGTGSFEAVDRLRKYLAEHGSCPAPAPVIRLPLPAVPERCGSCGHEGSEWPLGVFGWRLNLTCPQCHTPAAAIVAVGEDQS